MGVLDSLFFINLGCSEVADVGVTVDVAMVLRKSERRRRQKTAYLATRALWQHNKNTICALKTTFLEQPIAQPHPKLGISKIGITCIGAR